MTVIVPSSPFIGCGALKRPAREGVFATTWSYTKGYLGVTTPFFFAAVCSRTDWFSKAAVVERMLY